MTPEESPAAAFEQQRLRQEALLKEYEICQQEAEEQARRFWIFGGLLAPGVMVGVVFVLQLSPSIRAVAASLLLLVGTLVGLAVARWGFLRMWQMRVLMFARQRQIERELGMLKSHAVETLRRDVVDVIESVERGSGTGAETLRELQEAAKRSGRWCQRLYRDWVSLALVVVLALVVTYHVGAHFWGWVAID